MNTTTKLAIVAAIIALIGGSLFIPGPTEQQAEHAMSNWKSEVISIAQKDHEMLLKAGVFTKETK